jgi:hypothetical protein
VRHGNLRLQSQLLRRRVVRRPASLPLPPSLCTNRSPHISTRPAARPRARRPLIASTWLGMCFRLMSAAIYAACAPQVRTADQADAEHDHYGPGLPFGLAIVLPRWGPAPSPPHPPPSASRPSTSVIVGCASECRAHVCCRLPPPPPPPSCSESRLYGHPVQQL